MSIRWLVLLVLLSIPAATATWLLARPAPADASHPDLVEQAIADLLTFKTAYNGGVGGVLQVDVTQEIVTFDVDAARIHWDGDKLWIHSKHEAAPVILLAEWEDRVRDVWDEWRAGFPNTQFSPKSPATFDDRTRDRLGRTWFRVTLPFAWASDYLIYTTILNNGTMGRLSVYYADTLEPVPIGPRKIGRDTYLAHLREIMIRPSHRGVDVPLSPETYSPYRPERQPSPGGWRPGAKPGPHGEWAGPTWHQSQTFVRLVRADQNGGLIAGPQLSQRCETAPTAYSQPLNVVFAFPDDPDRAALAQLATTDCANAGFHSSLTVFHHVAPGAKTCATGTWRVVNTNLDPEVVVWQNTVNECRTGPDDARLEYPTHLPLPQGSDPTGLEVRFTGEVQVQCTAIGGPALSDVNNVLAGFELEHQPTLSWPGCYPGWNP